MNITKPTDGLFSVRYHTNFDGFVKSLPALLRGILRHCSVLLCTLHSSGFARLASGTFCCAVYFPTFCEIIKIKQVHRIKHNPRAILLVWISLSLFWMSCPAAAPGQPLGAKSHIEIIDALGKKVEIELPVKRLVALNSDVLEVIRSLKAESLVVGVFSEIARNPPFWPILKDKPKVGSWSDANPEIIAELRPDLVIAYSRAPGENFASKMASFGITVLRLDFYRIKTLNQEIKTLGRLLDRKKEAGRLCAWYQRNLNFIQGKLARVGRRPAVYVESYSDYHTTGPGSGGNEMCELAGGWNLAANFSIPYPQVTPEWVVSQNPQVIIKAVTLDNGYGLNNPTSLNSLRNTIMKRPAWNLIAAVQSGNVHVIESAIWTGPRAIIGIAWIAKWIHPDLFADLDPQVLHLEYLTTFQGLEGAGMIVSGLVTGTIR